MSKLAVIYWSMTGNTARMASSIAEGAQSAGAEVSLRKVSELTAADALTFDRIALGCPAMGAEVLEELKFEPFFAELEKSLSGRKVALFGSYGWGDGQWMRDWQERVHTAGGQLFRGEGLMLNGTPNEEGIVTCKTFGAEFASF